MTLDEVALERLDVERRRTARRSRSPRRAGRTRGECWCRTDRSSWLGHQSRLRARPVVGCRRRATGSPGSRSRCVLLGRRLVVLVARHGVALCVRCRSGVRSGGVPAAVGAGGAAAPVDDLGLVDLEAARRRRRSGRGLADGAVDVGDRAAGPADDVVVVVADPRLVAGDRARRLDAPDQARRRSARAARRRPPGATRRRRSARTAPMSGVGVGVRMGVHRGQHRQPRARHPQAGLAQHALEVRGRSARSAVWPIFWNRSRSGSDPGRSAGGPDLGYRARRRAAVQAPVPPQGAGR